MATATTKAYQVAYEILDTWAKIDLIRTQLMPIGFTMTIYCRRDDEAVDHVGVTFENPANTNRITVELGSERNVVVYDKGWLYNLTVAEALDKYIV